MNDKDFCDSYTIIRTAAGWKNGRWEIGEEQFITRFRPVQPATTVDLEQVPEGDRHKGVMKFFALPEEIFYLTQQTKNETDEGYISDEILYRGLRYKIVQIMPWNPNGYIRAFGVLLEV